MILHQYIKFILNGALLGLVAWALQGLIFQILDANDAKAYAIASMYTYILLILLNFYIQRRLIFNSSGCIVRFIIANIAVMILVSFLAPLCRLLIGTLWTVGAGDKVGFVLAALIGATPSFVLSRYFVFKKTSLKGIA